MQDHALTPFPFEGSTVRVIDVDGAPFFVAKDVAEVLGYMNPNKAVGDHCKGARFCYPLQTAGGPQEFRLISEPDVFRLIICSHLPTAQRFERWVMEEVLPQVRKTGKYAPAAIRAPQTMREALEMALELAKTNEALTAQAEVDAPKVAALERIGEAKGPMCIREAAKVLKVGQQELVALLLDRKWVFRDAGHRLAAFAKAVDAGLMHASVAIVGSEGDRIAPRARITPKGLVKLAGLLAERGVRNEIEKIQQALQ